MTQNTTRTLLPFALPLMGILAGIVLQTAHSADVDGMITKQSPHTVSQTLDRLEAALEDNGIGVALRWDHGDKARGENIELRDTELLIFGNPAVGSHFFTSAQTAGIDLPMKALAWKDADGQVWLGYNDPAYVADRHDIEDRAETMQTMANALDNLSDAAVAAE